MPRGRPKKNQGDDLMLKSAELIGWALGGLEREISMTRDRLSSLNAQANALRARLGGSRASTPDAGEDAPAMNEGKAGSAKGRRRRKMSPEARQRISEMMKKRWAERKKGR